MKNIKSKYKIANYSGTTINDWSIIGFSHIKGEQYWKVKCRCGSLHSVRATHIIRGKSKRCLSCGKKEHGKKLWTGGKFISSTFLVIYKDNAKRRNIDFNLTLADLENQWSKQSGRCIYTNEQLTLPKHSRDSKYNASIDRIDSSKGYTVDNIEWVTKTVNFMKQQLTKENFIGLCKIIALNN